MVTVGSLEAGLRVLSVRTSAMKGYIDGEFVRALDGEVPIIPQLARCTQSDIVASSAVREFWEQRFSLPAYVTRVGEALSICEATK
jgi:hypothetical protein